MYSTTHMANVSSMFASDWWYTKHTSYLHNIFCHPHLSILLTWNILTSCRFKNFFRVRKLFNIYWVGPRFLGKALSLPEPKYPSRDWGHIVSLMQLTDHQTFQSDNRPRALTFLLSDWIWNGHNHNRAEWWGVCHSPVWWLCWQLRWQFMTVANICCA